MQDMLCVNRPYDSVPYRGMAKYESPFPPQNKTANYEVELKIRNNFYIVRYVKSQIKRNTVTITRCSTIFDVTALTLLDDN